MSLHTADVGDFVVANERSGLPLTKVSKVVTSENLEEIRSKMLAGKFRLAIPLVGYRQRCSSGKQGEIEKQILEKEDVSPNEFRTTLMPEVSAYGGLRAATSSIIDFCVEKITPNEQNPRRNDVDVAFKLFRGSYATALLREIMKPKDIIAEGF
jgi:tRNA pseudouridine13 synthase